jgi:hypothetical protein
LVFIDSAVLADLAHDGANVAMSSSKQIELKRIDEISRFELTAIL